MLPSARTRRRSLHMPRSAATQLARNPCQSNLVEPRTSRSAPESRTRRPPLRSILRMLRTDHYLKMDNSQAALVCARQKPRIKHRTQIALRMTLTRHLRPSRRLLTRPAPLLYKRWTRATLILQTRPRRLHQVLKTLRLLFLALRRLQTNPATRGHPAHRCRHRPQVHLIKVRRRPEGDRRGRRQSVLLKRATRKWPTTLSPSHQTDLRMVHSPHARGGASTRAIVRRSLTSSATMTRLNLRTTHVACISRTVWRNPT